MKKRVESYTGYSVGCAVVWAAILIATGRADPETRDKFRRACMSWWSGWLSASIARLVYPPPKARTARRGDT
jgi:hypothetical protein